MQAARQSSTLFQEHRAVKCTQNYPDPEYQDQRTPSLPPGSRAPTHKVMLHRTNFDPSTYAIHKHTYTCAYLNTLLIPHTDPPQPVPAKRQFPPSPHIWENKSRQINLALPLSPKKGASPTSTLFGFWFPEQARSKHGFSEAINHPLSYLLSLTPGLSAAPCTSSFK